MPFEIIYTIEDNKTTSTTSIKLPSSTAFADVAIFAAQFAPLINDLILGVIVNIGVCFTVDLPGGLRSTPNELADVEEGARIQMKTAGGYDTAMRLPTLDESFIAPGDINLVYSQAEVIAMVAALEDGIDLTGAGGSGVIQPADGHDDDIERVVFMIEDFGKTRRPTL